MRRTIRYGVGCAMAALALLALVEPAVTQDTYTVIDVTTLEQAGGGIVRGLNTAGEIVGTSRSHVGKRGFAAPGRQGSGGRDRIERLEGFLDTDASAANAVNESGSIVGASNTATSVRAFVWTRGAGFSELNPLPGDTASEAWGLNRHDDVVGHSSGPGGIEAVLWRRNGEIEGLGRLSDADHSRAYAVNERLDIVGTSSRDGRSRAFLWTRSGGMEDLGAIAGNDQSAATGINNRGDVVGYSSGGGEERAFLWSRRDGMQDLGTLPGGAFSRAIAINERGDVVGRSDSPSGTRAVIWTRPGAVRDLNTMISRARDFVLIDAVGIDDRGAILAVGHGDGSHGADHEVHDTPTRVFLLVP